MTVELHAGIHSHVAFVRPAHLHEVLTLKVGTAKQVFDVPRTLLNDIS